MKGFLEHPVECLREDARPTSLGLMEEGVLFLGRHNVVNSGQSKPSQQQGLGKEGALTYLKGISDQGSAAVTPGKGQPLLPARLECLNQHQGNPYRLILHYSVKRGHRTKIPRKVSR